MPTAIEIVLNHYAADLEKRLKNRQHVGGLRSTKSPIDLVKDARRVTLDLVQRSANSKFRLATPSSGWTKRGLEEAREAIRRALREVDAEVLPFSVELPVSCASLSSHFKTSALTSEEIDDLKHGILPGEKFVDVLRLGHERRVNQELMTKFVGQDALDDIHKAMCRDFSSMEQSILNCFSGKMMARYKGQFADNVWLAIKLLFGYAVIGDGTGYDQLKPLVELYASDRICLPFCRRERRQRDPRRWLTLIGS